MDIVKVVNSIMGNTALSPRQFFIGDVNSDGIVNVIDIVGLVNSITGVTDLGHPTISQTIIVNVTPVNDNPVLLPINNQTVDEDSETLTIPLNAYDIDSNYHRNYVANGNFINGTSGYDITHTNNSDFNHSFNVDGDNLNIH